MFYGGKVIQALLDQETNDPVGIEDKVTTIGVLITNDARQRRGK